MIETQRLTVAARELRVGDRCRGSGAVVVRGPQRGLRTPAGKVELVVRYRRRTGSETAPMTVEWISSTRIAIDRDVTLTDEDLAAAHERNRQRADRLADSHD